MIYTIDIIDSNIIYRLSKEGVFENIENRGGFEVLPEDMIFDTYNTAKLYKARMGEYVIVDGERINCNYPIHSFGKPYVTISAKRTRRPKQDYFTKNQIDDMLIKGNDNRHNTLVVTFDGFVNLVSEDEKEVENFAVRYETFVAGNGYVGVKWKNNELEELYESLLQGWVTHLMTSESIYIEYNNGINAKESINEILNILNQYQ